MAPPFSARRPIPGIQPFFERQREITPPCVSSHYPHPRLVQLRGGIFERVRICTSHWGTLDAPLRFVCPLQCQRYLFRHRSMVYLLHLRPTHTASIHNSAASICGFSQ